MQDLYGSFNITHIGSGLAAKLLLIFDPNQKDNLISITRNALLNNSAKPELMSIDLKNGQISSRMWVKKGILSLFLPLPPSPIEFQDKSLDEIMQNIKNNNQG